MWISREVTQSLFDRLGFEVTFQKGNGRDLFFSAKLVDPERGSQWFKKTGVKWFDI